MVEMNCKPIRLGRQGLLKPSADFGSHTIGFVVPILSKA
jgi:hypothetical protein